MLRLKDDTKTAEKLGPPRLLGDRKLTLESYGSLSRRFLLLPSSWHPKYTQGDERERRRKWLRRMNAGFAPPRRIRSHGPLLLISVEGEGDTFLSKPVHSYLSQGSFRSLSVPDFKEMGRHLHLDRDWARHMRYVPSWEFRE